MLYTKCILMPASLDDGWRISVMSRHTLNDGITPDPRIQVSGFNEWLLRVAPPAVLVGNYYKRGLSWEDFENRYLDHIRQPHIFELVRGLARGALVSDITLLCIEDTAEYCHRRLLAEECQKYEPLLRILHR